MIRPQPSTIDLTMTVADPAKAEALAIASGRNPSAERATRWAIAVGLTVAAVALLAIFLTGCTPATWAAVEAAGTVAKVAACTICGAASPSPIEIADQHAKALRDITEAVARVAAERDAAETDAIRAELAASQARERLLTLRLLSLAGRPATAPAATLSGP